MTNKKQNQEVQQNGIMDNFAVWMKKNKNAVVAVFVTVIILGGIVACIENLREKSYQDQWSNLFMAEMAVANGGDATSYAPLEDFANKYKSKPAGVYANFVLGTALNQQGDFLKAEVFLTQALKYANPEFGAMITNSLIANTLELGDFERAIALADDFLMKRPTHFSIPQIKLYKAEGLELSGKIDAAKEIYKQLEEDYPNTYYSTISNAKLNPVPEPKKEEAQAPAKKNSTKTTKK